MKLRDEEERKSKEKQKESRRENGGLANCEKNRIEPQKRKERETSKMREKTKVSFYAQKNEVESALEKTNKSLISLNFFFDAGM